MSHIDDMWENMYNHISPSPNFPVLDQKEGLLDDITSVIFLFGYSSIHHRYSKTLESGRNQQFFLEPWVFSFMYNCIFIILKVPKTENHRSDNSEQDTV